ncbi:MAG TPA: TolC family protein [Candidatus Binataceae bacterium]|nr:TolC family protein [Candidatus Binataceae bacterium]
MSDPARLQTSAKLIAAPASVPLIRPDQELTLEQAIKIALAIHPKMIEAAANTGAAQQRVGEAKSYLGPQLFGTAQYLRSTDNGIGNTEYYDADGAFPRMTGRNHNLPSDDFSQSWDTSNNYMGGLALSQFLFDFGRRHGFVRQRQLEAAATAADQQLTELDLIFEVSQRYFAVLQAQQLIRVYEQAVQQRQFHLHEAQAKAKAGLRPQLDVYVTQAELERSQLGLEEARNSYSDARVGLDNAMGLSDLAPPYHVAKVVGYSEAKGNLKALIAQAMQTRPDLKAMQDQANAMGAVITEYRSDYFPTVNAVAGYAGMGTGLPTANNFNAGILITWPIFNSFLTRDQMAEADYTRHSIEAAIEDLRQQIILQVQTAFFNWQDSIKALQFAQRARYASRVELQLAQKRYETGLTDIVELEDAQRHFTEDDARFATAVYGAAVDNAALDQATARSLGGL